MICSAYKTLRILWLILSEALTFSKLQRKPEPTLIMDDPEKVRAFHMQGDPTGYLLPVYHFNAVEASKLIPHGGKVLDLGSGSGQYLMYLAKVRPDIKIIGLDLSAEMVELGNATIKEQGLSQRLMLVEGDMTDFSSGIKEKIDLVSSVFAFHHLPSMDNLKRCMGEIAAICEKFGSAVWAFDHVRPKLNRTAKTFPKIFTPDAPSFFCQDSTNSLLASFSFVELSAQFNDSLKTQVFHRCANLMRLYQIHWAYGSASLQSLNQDNLSEDGLSIEARRAYRSLQQLFGYLQM